MPKVGEVIGNGPELIEVPALGWLQEAVQPGFIRGAAYLLSGEPGNGKTALVVQLLGSLASDEVKVLYIATEQGLGDVKRVVERIHGDGDLTLPEPIRDNLYIDDSVEGVESLPRFLMRRVLGHGEEYHGVQAIVVDSVQGRGLASTATSKYRHLYQFIEAAKAHGLLVLLTGHVTKRGQIAGPKDLEHNVDAIIQLRRAFNLRPLFVPKNRYGPALLDPLILTMDGRGRLIRSPHSAARSITALGYGGVGEDLAEAQASVSLPRYGARPELNAPYLPVKKIRQLVSVLSTLPDIGIGDLSYQVNCYIPGQQRYRHELDLAIAVALLGSYLRQPVPSKSLFVGELDLTRRVRAPEHAYLSALGHLLIGPQFGRVDSVYVSKDAVDDLRNMRPDPNGPPLMEILTVRGVGDLEGLLRELWPGLFRGHLPH